MNINHLRYFTTIARTGSYARASEELYVSSPSLTYAIKALEQELGAPLLHSSNKGTSLTEYGRYFLPFAEKTLDVIGRGSSGIQDMAHGEQIVDAAVVGPMCNMQAPWYIKKFEDSPQGNNVHVAINFAPSADAIDMLRSGLVDVAFAGVELGDELVGLNYHPLAYDDLYLIVPKGHPLATKKNVSMRDCLKYDFIGFSNHTGVRGIISHRFQEECGCQPRVIAESDFTFQIAGMVGAGMGIALSPDAELFQGLRITARQIDNKPWRRIFGILFREEAFPRKPVVDFVNFVKSWSKEPVPVMSYPDQRRFDDR